MLEPSPRSGSLYKYLPGRYVSAFVERGVVLFRSLSYFRAYEDSVRGDRLEGSRLFHPSQGLDVTKVETGEKFNLPWAFESRVRDREIFVFCLSRTRSAALAKEFGADACIELRTPVPLLAGVRAALARRPRIKNKQLVHGPVHYYPPGQAPLAAWAVPEQVVMSKTLDYAAQAEYRLSFALGDAFALNNVSTLVTSTPGAQLSILEGHPQYLLKIGSLRRICKVHWYT